MGWPSENFAPRRRRQVQVLPSALASHDLARKGVSCCVALLKSASVQNIRFVMSVEEFSFAMIALNGLGVQVSPNTNRPPGVPISLIAYVRVSGGSGYGSLYAVPASPLLPPHPPLATKLARSASAPTARPKVLMPPPLRDSSSRSKFCERSSIGTVLFERQ